MAHILIQPSLFKMSFFHINYLFIHIMSLILMHQCQLGSVPLYLSFFSVFLLLSLELLMGNLSLFLIHTNLFRYKHYKAEIKFEKQSLYLLLYYNNLVSNELRTRFLPYFDTQHFKCEKKITWSLGVSEISKNHLYIFI